MFRVRLRGISLTPSSSKLTVDTVLATKILYALLVSHFLSHMPNPLHISMLRFSDKIGSIVFTSSFLLRNAVPCLLLTILRIRKQDIVPTVKLMLYTYLYPFPLIGRLRK
jgi:hypothetical protein